MARIVLDEGTHDGYYLVVETTNMDHTEAVDATGRVYTLQSTEPEVWEDEDGNEFKRAS